MKRFLILLLAVVMVFCFAACDSGSDESSSNATSSKSQVSSTAASSEEESSVESTSSEETSSEVTSSEATSSEDVSSGTESGGEVSKTPDGETVAEFITQFFSWEGTIGAGTVGVKTTGASSVRLTGLNTGAVDGTAGILAFNSDYADTVIYSEDGNYDKYEVFVFEYDHDVWGCVLTESYDLEAAGKDDIEIPEDGFVVAIHSYFADYITAVKSATEDAIFTPYGFRSTNEIDVTISEGTATIDGNISEDEYGAPVWILDPESEYVSYEQFDLKAPDDGYYSTADVYMMYDSEYLYLAVVVDSPYHYNNLEPSKPNEMYNQECIQVNVCSVDPKGEFISSNWDNHEQHVNNASSKNIVRQYGFGVNENNETLSHVWIGSPTTFSGNAVCTRNDDDQLTYYEIAIPLSELGETDAPVVGEAGTVMGLSLSINSGREDASFMNYYLRDGGGIIGRNDWTKVPQITFD